MTEYLRLYNMVAYYLRTGRLGNAIDNAFRAGLEYAKLTDEERSGLPTIAELFARSKGIQP